MKYISYFLSFAVLSLVSCHQAEHEKHEEHHTGTFLVTRPVLKDTLIENEFVAQIHSHQRIELSTIEKGYLEKILVDEGQIVKKGQLLFKIQPTIYQAEKEKSQAELQTAKIEYENTKALVDVNVVSESELSLAKATLEKAKADLSLADAHLKFTEIRAPFDGIVGKFEDVRLGSLLDEGELLTTLSDNSKMWVYFNVPEAQYLEYATNPKSTNPKSLKLKLANKKLFDQEGTITAIESDFNNTTGTIPFRATFNNPSKLLRNGQTGNILWPIHIENAMIIPQKSTFEILDKKYVFLVDKEGNIKSQEIKIGAEMDHLYVVTEGLNENSQILLEGLRKVQNGDKIAYKLEDPNAVLNRLELHAE
jgi:membrane fusion protein (multidrug efflux system)